MAVPSLLSLGSINADFQLRVDAPPGSAETLRARDLVRLSGGKAANVAFLARRLEHPAWLLGRVGADDLAEQALAAMRRVSVKLEGVTVAQEAQTAVSLITVGPDGKKAIALAGNANQCWDGAAHSRVLEVIDRVPAGSVLVADYEVPAAIVAAAVGRARQRGMTIVIDPSFADEADPEILAQAHALTPNAAEAASLAGLAIDGPKAAAEAAMRLTAHAVQLVCIKLEDGGCVARVDGQTWFVPAVPVPVIDSTGAGDAFTGALGVALLERQPWRAAVLFATAASHCAVTAYGSQPSYPARTAIEEMRSRLAAGVQLLDGR
jgi:ribokinase